MNTITYLSASFLAISIVLNIFLFLKSKNKLPASRTQSIELQEFLTDLMQGGSMIAVRRIDPNDILLRSPRQSR